MNIKENNRLKIIKEKNINLFNKIMQFKSDITDFNTYLDNLLNQDNFKTNILFSNRTTGKLGIYFEKITVDLKHLIEETYISKFSALYDFSSISYIIHSLTLILKTLLMKIKKRMISSGNYINSYHNYYKSFPLTKFNEIECTILILENKLNISLNEVLNNGTIH